ncbi:MAG: S8 family serine peptidase, partial [Candidatus Heimdallarchaeota archaeon]|nr:S8 family serine peptidase [Candidatus Heimdallarchaeota archaeon]
MITLISLTLLIQDGDGFNQIKSSREFTFTIYNDKLRTISAESDVLAKPNKQNNQIVLFTSSRSYSKFIQTTNSTVKNLYPNLRALRVDLLYSEVQLLKDQGNQVVPQSFFSLTLESQKSLTNPDRVSLFQENARAEIIGLDGLHQLGYNGSEVNIAVIDNGIDALHPDLIGRVIFGVDISTGNSFPCKNHGTLVAGTIIGNPVDNNLELTGTAVGSTLFDVSFGCIGNTVEGDILAGFEWILQNNSTIDVVNTSFGGFAPAWDFIVEKLETAGIITIGSAGNSGPALHSTLSGGPGNSLYAISVGSVNHDSGLSTFSSRGPAHNMNFKPAVLG